MEKEIEVQKLTNSYFSTLHKQSVAELGLELDLPASRVSLHHVFCLLEWRRAGFIVPTGLGSGGDPMTMVKTSHGFPQVPFRLSSKILLEVHLFMLASAIHDACWWQEELPCFCYDNQLCFWPWKFLTCKFVSQGLCKAIQRKSVLKEIRIQRHAYSEKRES